MRRFVWIIAILFALSIASQSQNVKPELALKAIAEQQGEHDPIVGVWIGRAGGYTWKTAIIRNPYTSRGAIPYVAVLIQPWPNFKAGEVHMHLTNPGSNGTYYGQEKWEKNYFYGIWQPVSELALRMRIS